jgi:arylsulfatase A
VDAIGGLRHLARVHIGNFQESTAMHKTGHSLAALIFLAAISSLVLATEERPPNVIVILTDDQGTIDANCFGAKDLVTPGIDGLAERGVRFTQFYAAAPVCSPSRAGLITGRYPVRAGVPGNVSSQQGQAGMSPDQVTMAETFKAADYATAHIGKWHLGYTPETMPNNQGFDHSFGHMGGCIDNYSHFFYWQGPNRHDLWRNGTEVFHDGRYFPDLMVDETVEFIEQQRDEPFLVYFAINLPHYPYQGDAHWLEYYRDLPYPRNLYAAFVSAMDARILRLTQALDRLGLRQQTIVVFQSDHGHSCEERAHFGGGNAGPYRGAKFSLFEGGIRVPAVISWPGRLPENAVRGQVAHSCDWLPTLAELCGVPLLNEDIDGRSLTAVIQSETAQSPHDVLHWTTGNSWAVREGDWKLLGEPRDTANQGELTPDDKRFLVNLADDASEMRNLAAENPEVVRRLESLHQRWIESVPSPAAKPKR